MKFLRHNCQQVTALVLAGEDRRLGWAERCAVFVHLRICAACPAFKCQVALMRRAMPRWRAYRETSE